MDRVSTAMTCKSRICICVCLMCVCVCVCVCVLKKIQSKHNYTYVYTVSEVSYWLTSQSLLIAVSFPGFYSSSQLREWNQLIGGEGLAIERVV